MFVGFLSGLIVMGALLSILLVLLEESFEYDAEAIWMAEHCAEYGFILRYPKGKQDVTGIIFEPWHFRYVGVEIATYIMENNLTLEEYLGAA